jgi:hypothetical protein
MTAQLLLTLWTGIDRLPVREHLIFLLTGNSGQRAFRPIANGDPSSRIVFERRRESAWSLLPS